MASKPEPLVGRRVPDGQFLTWRAEGRTKPGDYGCDFVNVLTGDDEDVEVVQWFVMFPDGRLQKLMVDEPDTAGNYHMIEQHDDGTITVNAIFHGEVIPTAKIMGGPLFSGGSWQGHLEHGVWRPGEFMPLKGGLFSVQ